MIDLYGTLGPACAEESILRQLFQAGMTGVRLNLSHVSLKQSAPWLSNLSRAAAACNIRPKLLIDLQGPELRIGDLPLPLPLENGSRLVLGEGGVPVPQLVLEALSIGQQVLLDDGKILAEVMGVLSDCALCRVLRGGTLQSRKSIGLPGQKLHPPALTRADLDNLSQAADWGVTGVMQPFVRDREDLKAVSTVLNRAGGTNIQIIAKLENLEGVKALPELLPYADAFVIARGDLGNDTGLPALPAIQKDLARALLRAKKPFIIATQLLSTMEHNPVPTRAEVSDIFNGVLDGASGLMLTGETAVGKHPVAAMTCLKEVRDKAVAWMQAQK